MSDSELLKQIAELKTWNLELLVENERLREMLNMSEESFKETSPLPDIRSR